MYSYSVLFTVLVRSKQGNIGRTRVRAHSEDNVSYYVTKPVQVPITCDGVITGIFLQTGNGEVGEVPCDGQLGQSIKSGDTVTLMWDENIAIAHNRLGVH